MESHPGPMRHCATFREKRACEPSVQHSVSCVHHEEHFVGFVRGYHFALGLAAVVLLTFVCRHIKAKSKNIRSSRMVEAILLFGVGGVLLIVHSMLKAFSSSCLSNTEVGAECGQIFSYIIFDVISLSHCLCMLYHPCMGSWPRYARINNEPHFGAS